MTTVGSFEAKTHLPQLLDRVARGERILITRHGKPAAMLVPAPATEENNLKRIIAEFKEYSKRQGRTLGGLSARDMIEEGRRF
jgi:prevent-host-death family protein